MERMCPSCGESGCARVGPEPVSWVLERLAELCAQGAADPFEVQRELLARAGEEAADLARRVGALSAAQLAGELDGIAIRFRGLGPGVASERAMWVHMVCLAVVGVRSAPAVKLAATAALLRSAGLSRVDVVLAADGTALCAAVDAHVALGEPAAGG